ncbi:sensor histidine kinase [Pseudoalteromonas tunicata]|uniref:Putative transmembrane sensor histidine kinase transcription regulator protein n=1 Tax=Pseudoalteromonas tunicata D2 TaxID=87626 RepID=A4CE81_9GAMM|nr:histidine kinase [Pseudoalteromonas tunicata]ATC93071.1 two-component system, LytT family, sensor kinase [Pseudoalteromonas tunicata]AXT32146.1 sensor histidine kinase [Pseudoalteromonas tunicata]EAR26893.1 putative transmembrane sensor histidine kinase transcription regulator protein [Pseudoalteromonas tunicata D2]MDP5213614.1 histidine kinase [Pseudoalteromonas tunicata]
MFKLLRQHRVLICVQVSLTLLLALSTIGIPDSLKDVDSNACLSFMHQFIQVVVLPCTFIYFPLNYLLYKKNNSRKRIYLLSLAFGFLTGLASATYTHTISSPGSFLLKLEAEKTSATEPKPSKQITDKDAQQAKKDKNDDDNSVSFGIHLGNSTEGYKNSTGVGIFFAEMFIHGLFYCLLALILLQYQALAHKRKLKKQLKQQQLDILTYQLNPHFLFNSLNSIRGMLYEDANEAKTLLQQFRALFKHHFENKQHLQTLEKEIELCQLYLELEKVRFEERLELVWLVDQKALAAILPSMSLFTFVENAIKHGITPLIYGGKITIRARVYRAKFTLEVTNPIKPNHQADGTKTGLANLSQRLDLIYGKHSQLTSHIIDGSSYQVTLVIPFTVKKHD